MSTQTSGVAAPALLKISIAHSPDSDDAFMFYGLATNKVRVPGYHFNHTLCDIETLNRRAREEAARSQRRHAAEWRHHRRILAKMCLCASMERG